MELNPAAGVRDGEAGGAAGDEQSGRRGRRRPTRPVIAIVIAVQVMFVALAAVLIVRGLPSSTGSPARPPLPPVKKQDRFDAPRAMRIAKLQIDAGPRPAGSPTLRRVAERLRRRLPGGRFERVPGHPGLRNIVGELPGPGPVLVFAAHYDTESHPPGFVGANDAAAAVGAVIELSRALRRLERPATAPGIRFVLFDGEEEPDAGSDFATTALRGSRAYVSRHAEEVRALFLLDYIGGKGLRLPREASSDRRLWRAVRAAARSVGAERAFPDRTGVSIMDDHTPFLQAGIPAVDFIDWDYRYKDTVHDTYDKLDVRSVDAVGETLVALVRAWDRQVARASGRSPAS